MKDDTGSVIYVGKRCRYEQGQTVFSIFQESFSQDPCFGQTDTGL